ncbi:MAG: hypothetical protein O9266_08110 [Porphyrobacter sp.]|nr:hypothetical protein [Porphyrobacter sp.]
MTHTAKRCTKCGETKPLAEFYLRRAGDPSGPRRATCKVCDKAEGDRRRAEGPSVIAEIMRVGTSCPELLSDRARAAAFPNKPIDPALIAAWQAREKAKAKRARRAELRRSQDLKPMRFARMETYA